VSYGTDLVNYFKSKVMNSLCNI